MNEVDGTVNGIQSEMTVIVFIFDGETASANARQQRWCCGLSGYGKLEA